MQSSPPTRAWVRPSSRAESEYSLDLNALNLQETQLDIDIPKQKVDRIYSSDIDGPSDFTQNMEMWMRGGPASRKNTLRGLKQSTRAIQEVFEHEDKENQNPERLQVPGKAEDERTESHHTPDNSPPKVPPHHQSEIEETEDERSELDHTGWEEGFSSEWQTYGSTSTPAVPAHRHFLQPTVEDYYSELSPARQTSAMKDRGRSLRSSKLVESYQPPEKEPTTPGRPSSPTLSPVRSPFLERSKTGDDRYDKEVRNDMENQMQLLQTKWQELEHLNQALGQALDEEKRMRRDDQLSHEAQIAEALRREKDLVDMKEAAYQHNDDFRREFGELKKRLQDHEQEADNAKQTSNDSERELRAEVQRLKDRLDLQQMQHIQETRGLKQDLELARKGREHAEEAARTHRMELDEQRSLHDGEVERLMTDLRQTRADEATIMGLERQLQDANAEIKRLKTAGAEQETAMASMRSQLAKIKQSHEGETLRLSSDRIRAVELASNLQRQLQELRQQLKDEQSSHEEEVQRLRTQQGQTSETSLQELEVVRAELEAKQTELNEAILERDEAKDELAAHQSDESLRIELEDMKAVNAELDARITERLQRREMYWREKLEEADRERQLMAKALLHQWGREEVGIDSPQVYAYKYLNKPSAGKSPKSPTKMKAKAAA